MQVRAGMASPASDAEGAERSPEHSNRPLHALRHTMTVLPSCRHMGILALLILALSRGAAQEPGGPDTLMSVELDTIVVTGVRGGGETLAIPLAVGVVGPKDFALSRQAGLSEALWGMPGVLAQNRSGSSDLRLTIRGFGARGNGDRSNSGTVRGIKILVDGFPETEPDGRTSLDLVDLGLTERIEVLRTNASSLFGNASGGVVNIQTAPVLSRPKTELGARFGAFGYRAASAELGTVFGTNQLWLSASGADFDGWRENSASRRRLISAGLTSDLGDSASLRLVASGVENRYSIPGALTQKEFRDTPTMADPAYLAHQERRENVVARFGASLSKSWSEHSLEVLAYYAPKLLKRSERGTYRNFNRYHTGGGITYNWAPAGWSLNPRVVVGLDEAYQDGTILFYTLENGERGDSLRTNKREGANTLGGFGQLTLDVVERLSLVAGLRWDEQTYLSEVYPAGATTAGAKDKLALSHVTPRVGLLYRLSLNHSLYVNYGGGLEAPAFNEVDPPPGLGDVELNPFLKPMVSATLEAGVKGVELLGDGQAWVKSVSYSLAIYYISVRDEIVPYNGGAWYFSAGKSHRAGLEIGADVEIRYGIAIKAALTLLDATYDEYENNLGDFAGNDVPGIPNFAGGGRLRYQSPFGLEAEVGLDYVGSYCADDAGMAKVPSYTLVGGALGYTLRGVTETLSAQVGVQNVFNRHYAASAYINPAVRAGSPAYLEPGLPRNFFGGIKVSIVL